MKTIYMLPAAMLVLGSAAYADEKVSAETKSKTTVQTDDDGSYKKKQSSTAESTDAAGTTTSSQTKVEVKQDADGDAEKKVTTETVTDPKGLLNKTKTVTTDSVKFKDGEVEKSHKKKVDGKVVEENTTTN